MDINLKFSEKPNKNKTEIGQGVANKEHSLDGFPHTCKKCGHDKADVVDLGAPWGDESNITLFTCKKCGFSQRETEGCSNMRS